MKEYIFSRPDKADDTVKRDANYRGELIRCKDCKYWRDSYYDFIEGKVCGRTTYIRAEDDYCSMAERKEK